jgi:hypothetical protein
MTALELSGKSQLELVEILIEVILNKFLNISGTTTFNTN